jgi:hypothetical protein
MRTSGTKVIFGLILASSACVFEGDQAAPPPPPLDVVLAPGETRAGLIIKETELIGGVTAKAKVGDFKIYNDEVAFVIGRAGLSRGYHPYGGQILDVDRIHEGPGRSSFGEVISAFDLSVLRVDTVEVVNDGGNGEAARIRAKGEADVFPLFDALFSKIFESKTYDMDWTVDYVLEPNADFLKIEHRLKNRGREEIDFGLPILAFMFGDGADPFAEGYGFAPPSGSGTSPYYGAVDDEVTYLIGRPDSRLNFVVSESGIVVTSSGDGFTLRGREEIVITNHLVVGDGNLSKTQAAWRRAAGGEEGARISGTVENEAGEPVAGARVHVVEAEPSNAERDYVTRAVSGEDGGYELYVPAGPYDLIVATDGKLVTPRMRIDATESREDVDLTVPRVGRVRYSVKDDAGRDLPVKLSIESTAGAFEQLPARYGEQGQSFGLVATVFAHTGAGELALLPGEYRILISRGIEYEIAQPTVTVAAGETAEVEAVLARSVSTPGWMTTDTHIHSQLSPDSPDLFPFKVRTMVVENLEVPVSTEHEAIGDFNPAIAELGLESWMKGIIGSEITTFTYGHFNAFPLIPDPLLPGNGRVSWYHKTPGEMFAAIRENPGDAFVQVNHPRGAAVGGYFSAMGFDREAYTFRLPDQFSADFDGIEVLNGCGNGTLSQEPIQDWFAFLNHGMKRFGTASTDNHKAAGGDMGLPVTYVRMPTDSPPEANADDFRAAFKSGRLTLSCGPFVEMSVGDAIIGDTVTLEGDALEVRARVAAASWIDVDAIDVLIDGKVEQTIPLVRGEGTTLFDGNITVPLPAGSDAWIALSARGDQRHGVWARRRPSFALTNPIFVDGNGDGAWTMGR